jgi:hypothetical protein
MQLHWQKLDLEFEPSSTGTEYSDLKTQIEQELDAVYGVAWFYPRDGGNLPYPCFCKPKEGLIAFTSLVFCDTQWWEETCNRLASIKD